MAVPSNAFSPQCSIVPPNFIDFSAEQSLKASFFIVFTVCGIVTEVSVLMFVKAPALITVTAYSVFRYVMVAGISSFLIFSVSHFMPFTFTVYGFSFDVMVYFKY